MVTWKMQVLLTNRMVSNLRAANSCGCWISETVRKHKILAVWCISPARVASEITEVHVCVKGFCLRHSVNFSHDGISQKQVPWQCMNQCTHVSSRLSIRWNENWNLTFKTLEKFGINNLAALFLKTNWAANLYHNDKKELKPTLTPAASEKKILCGDTNDTGPSSSCRIIVFFQWNRYVFPRFGRSSWIRWLQKSWKHARNTPGKAAALLGTFDLRCTSANWSQLTAENNFIPVKWPHLFPSLEKERAMFFTSSRLSYAAFEWIVMMDAVACAWTAEV